MGSSWIDSLAISVLVTTALANSAFAVIAPFLPIEFAKKDLGQDLVGAIFSTYSVAVILFSPLICTYLIPYFGRRKLV